MAKFGKLGWILGLIFGATVGLLFAPRKGKELREQMKSDRKKGKLGFSPLQQDMKQLGKQLADIARDFYNSEVVQDVVEKGRKKVKDLSDDFVEDVTDFHYSRVSPIKKEVENKVEFAKEGIAKGKKVFKDVKRKAKKGAKIGKKAIRDIKKEFKK